MKSSVNLVVEPIPSQMSFNQYIEVVTSSTGYQYENQRYYDQNGLHWHEAISLNQSIKLLQKTVMHDGKAFIFTFGAHPVIYDQQIQIFEDIINTVKFN
ncbi:hypothetical protein [Bacillus sp. T33-2]|uniref:hypothetical protein n=1 Tax=Bacillus sp. T33-2 TaxID=2054168 RepID=UPI000C766017|nr:hypothetical protein [Bacillus sp. T33-2]PLR91934.1 hypothetical protein CVD19_21330 [Bacillus sp. T33-2]